MKPNAIRGKAQTVMGVISGRELGITLAHEHCLVDISCLFAEPTDEVGKGYAFQPVTFETVGYIRYHVINNRDNLKNLDQDMAVKELKRFRMAGGRTVVDATNVDLGRDPIALQRISRETGLNIIMGCGYYVKGAQKLIEMEQRSEDSIAEEMVRDIREGVGATRICSGVIGEIGCSWPIEECEKKVLRAAGLAQNETGAPLVVHPGRHEHSPREIIGILKEVGTDLSHAVISHVDRTLFEAENRYAVAESGCYLAYDIWGNEGYFSEFEPAIDVLNDSQRIAQVKDLIARGYSDRILVSHDICFKSSLYTYGGHGYAHILLNAVPAMRRRGVSEEHIDRLLRRNPQEFFVFK